VSYEDDLRHCHGFTVDTDAGHLGSVLHVREPRPGVLELHVATPGGVVRVPREAIRHFDAHEKRIAVILPASEQPQGIREAHPDAAAV
jgi:hypothetical protein